MFSSLTAKAPHTQVSPTALNSVVNLGSLAPSNEKVSIAMVSVEAVIPGSVVRVTIDGATNPSATVGLRFGHLTLVRFNCDLEKVRMINETSSGCRLDIAWFAK